MSLLTSGSATATWKREIEMSFPITSIKGLRLRIAECLAEERTLSLPELRDAAVVLGAVYDDARSFVTEIPYNKAGWKLQNAHVRLSALLG